jgi:flagellar motility protein MotE (MotC chaperone)
VKNQEEKKLREIRAKMSKQQRDQMSEILQNEMKRRGMDLKSEREQDETVSAREEVSHSGSGAKMAAKVAFLVAIAVLGGAKIYFGSDGAPSGEARALLEREIPVSGEEERKGQSEPKIQEQFKSRGSSERELVADLDARRVELEKRKEGLDRREEELKAQADALTERLAELRGLTARLGEVRKTEDSRKQSKFDQLANVYTAMAPNEAATLLSRLEPSITIDLLERMPEKRIGQILGLMDRERAVELTRLLTERKITP